MDWPLKAGACLIQVATKAGLTVYIIINIEVKQVIESPVGLKDSKKSGQCGNCHQQYCSTSIEMSITIEMSEHKSI